MYSGIDGEENVNTLFTHNNGNIYLHKIEFFGKLATDLLQKGPHTMFTWECK